MTCHTRTKNYKEYVSATALISLLHENLYLPSNHVPYCCQTNENLEKRERLDPSFAELADASV